MAANRRLKKSALFCGMFLLVLMVMGWGTGICRTDKAVLKVITDPDGAKVTVDTGEEGITPCTLEVPEGQRRLKIKKRAYVAARVEVEVSSAEPTEVEVKLTPLPTTMRDSNHLYCNNRLLPCVAYLFLLSPKP